MTGAPSQKGMRFATASLIFTTIACGFYLAWTFISRYLDNRRAEEAFAAEQAKANRELIKVLGDGSLKIHTFYVSPNAVQSGSKALLCYGVSNAKSVRLEPPVENITPALSRCIEVTPKVTTQYILVAQDNQGGRREQSVELKVVGGVP